MDLEDQQLPVTLHYIPATESAPRPREAGTAPTAQRWQAPVRGCVATKVLVLVHSESPRGGNGHVSGRRSTSFSKLRGGEEIAGKERDATEEGRRREPQRVCLPQQERGKNRVTILSKSLYLVKKSQWGQTGLPLCLHLQAPC